MTFKEIVGLVLLGLGIIAFIAWIILLWRATDD